MTAIKDSPELPDGPRLSPEVNLGKKMGRNVEIPERDDRLSDADQAAAAALLTSRVSGNGHIWMDVWMEGAQAAQALAARSREGGVT
jgi:hypothetical protein